MLLRHLVALLAALLTFGLVPAVAAAAPPTASFTVMPAAPIEDQPVEFEAVANCAATEITCIWTSSDGLVGTGRRIIHQYADPGTYQVSLVVTRTRTNGRQETSSSSISLVVLPAAPAPPAPPAPPASDDSDDDPDDDPEDSVQGTGTPGAPPVEPTGAPAAGPPAGSPTPAGPAPADLTGSEPRSTPPSRTSTELRIMSPFPIVRIAGSVGVRGTRLTLFSVRGPRAARVVVRCLGRNRGCPFRRREHLVRPSLSRDLKLHGRLLRPGALLDIRVIQAGRVGKRTTLRFRPRRGPARTDGCVTPTGGVRRC
jgi:hypothetical protein